MAPMAVPSSDNGNGYNGDYIYKLKLTRGDLRFLLPGYSGSIGGVPLGVPMSNHEYDMTDADSFNSKGFYSVGANPPPAWSQRECDH